MSTPPKPPRCEGHSACTRPAVLVTAGLTMSGGQLMYRERPAWLCRGHR